MNPRLAGIPPSMIRMIAAKRGPHSIDLGLGEPTLPPPIEPLEAATRWVAEHGCAYTPNAGDPALRALIAQHYGYPGMQNAEHVCITTGSQEALYCAINALLDPGQDELLVVQPAFGAYAKIAQLAGITVRTVMFEAATYFAFDEDRILAALQPQTRMLVLCSPCNPTGRVLRAESARRLAQALLARSGPPVIVLFDEVYRELTYIDDAASFATYYPHTIAINSLSKSHALTGLRLGWALGPEEYLRSIIQFHAWVSSAASTFAQRVAWELFSQPQGMALHQELYRQQWCMVQDLLAEYSIACAPIEGSFYAFLPLREKHDSLEVALRLVKEEQLLVIPGQAFGADAWLRISWVAERRHLVAAMPALIRQGVVKATF